MNGPNPLGTIIICKLQKKKFEFELSRYFDDYGYWLLASTGLVAVVSGC